MYLTNVTDGGYVEHGLKLCFNGPDARTTRYEALPSVSINMPILKRTFSYANIDDYNEIGDERTEYKVLCASSRTWRRVSALSAVTSFAPASTHWFRDPRRAGTRILRKVSVSRNCASAGTNWQYCRSSGMPLSRIYSAACPLSPPR